ncbi:MAG: DUF2971 domain-containing protein [Crenarchaeota archaeon]|nr:DUF2971 domain-containing protein [Thermoproteota archaeon]
MTHRTLTYNEIKSAWYKYAWASAKDAGSGLPYALKNLKENTLYFQSPIEFNDLYDCKMVINQCTIEEWKIGLKKSIQTVYANLGQDQQEKIFNNLKNNQQISYNNFKSIRKRDFEKYGVVCLTNKPTDILMWAYYGEKNTGICLGIDLEHCINTLVNIMSIKIFRLKHVDYVNTLPKINFMESFLSSNENTALYEIEKIIFSKNKVWEKEKEIRIAIPKVEELAKRRLICFPEGIYKSVILGARCDPFTIEQVKDILSSKKKQIPLFQIVPSEQKYNLELNRLDY